ncbi:hypothetical protein Tco_0486713 [Tanacetum coccineum]
MVLVKTALPDVKKRRREEKGKLVLFDDDGKLMNQCSQPNVVSKPSNEKAEVQIPLSSVLEVHLRFDFSLYGYFIGTRVAFPVVENYVRNAWKKYGIIRVMKKPSNFLRLMLLVPIWVKLYDIPIVVFTEDGLSAMATKLCIPVMLDSNTSSMCLQSWGHLDYARALIDVRANLEFSSAFGISLTPYFGDYVEFKIFYLVVY